MTLLHDTATGNDSDILVSIVIRSMGRPCVADAIASVAAQQHRPLELLVVDASGGAHPPLPPTPALSSARLVGAGRRLNRPAAANLGLEEARGDWIGFLDDDDFLEPTHVARLLARAREPDRPRVVYGQLWVLDRFHRVVQQRQQRVNPLIMYYNCQISAMSVLLHRSLRDAGHRLDETLGTSEDWDFWMRLMPHAHFGTVTEPTHFYFSEAGTSGTGIGRNRHNDANHARFHALVKARYAADRDRLWVEHFERLNTGMALQRAGRVEEALAFYAATQQEYPDEPNTMFLMAQTFVQAGQLQTARRMFQQAIYLNGDAADYRMALGDVCAQLGQPDEARDAYTGALHFNAALKTDIAARLAQLPLPEAATHTGKDAGGIGGRNARCPCGSGLRYKACHGRINMPRAPVGDAALARALDEALASARTGEANVARAQFEAVVATNPGVMDAHHALALLALDMRELPEAEARIVRARELAPDDPQVQDNYSRIVAARFEEAGTMRIVQRLAELPYLVAAGGAAPVPPGTPVHIISPFESLFGGSEMHALDLSAILGTEAPVTLWSTSPRVPAAFAARGVRALDPNGGMHPREGILVFLGTWQAPPVWVRASVPARLIVMHNVENAPGLLDLLVALHAQSSLPIQILMPSDIHRLRSGVAGASYPSPIDLRRFVPPPWPRPAGSRFVVGRLSRNEHTKFHPNEPALIRRLLAQGLAMRLQGATVLLRHFPPSQPVPGLELLPAGTEDAAAFLRTLDAFYYRTGPHWREPSGRVVAEAMACGLPCLCARSVGFSDLIDHGVSGFVFDDHDEDAVAGHLSLLRDDPERRLEMGRAARAKAEATFGPALHRRIRALYLG